ncbi:MAG TPA: hypothetical protein VMU86_03465 [Steroidobacteraceae bacterium]|nr:hypothetical protein [Steroidobacteraceae bacterium]
MKTLTICAAVAAFAFAAAGTATAGSMSGMKMEHATKAATLGRHSMPATVTKVDHKNGMVWLNSFGMHLAVHFPPPAIASLKAGDKIVLHLGYSKAD